MKVTIDDREIKLDKPRKVSEIIDNKDRRYLGCLVNNHLKNLEYVIERDSEIKLLDVMTFDGVRIYHSTLRYIVAMAVKNIYPKAKVHFSYSVSRSIFASVSGLGHAFMPANLDKIKAEVDRIIAEDYPISYVVKNKDELIEYYKSIGYYDKIGLLKYAQKDQIHVYECNGYYNYLFNVLAASTGVIKKYDLKLYSPGFVIRYPRIETNGELPDFQDEKVFRSALKSANIWANNLGCESISQVNEIIDGGKALEFINMCETGHNIQLTHLGDKIEENINNIKLICVAGPSSSGKTTFTNRLRIELKTRGYEPLMISMDDYYKTNLEDYPIGEDGKPDFEDIRGLDLDLFDQTLFGLIQGDEMPLPTFDFTNRRRLFSEPVRLKPNQPVLIEGIHGLNSLIAPSISDEQKFKIYIAPIGQSRIDFHTPVSISDLRLMRRIVRDNETRGRSAEKTIMTWPSVRNGEYKWIYPNQNNADFVFNSELSYEIYVLKKHILPLLNMIKEDSPAFNTAKRLEKSLKYYEDISDKWVPCNSILREFIGDSIFYTNDKK